MTGSLNQTFALKKPWLEMTETCVRRLRKDHGHNLEQPFLRVASTSFRDPPPPFFPPRRRRLAAAGTWDPGRAHTT